jgi:hypothetical protein
MVVPLAASERANRLARRFVAERMRTSLGSPSHLSGPGSLFVNSNRRHRVDGPLAGTMLRRHEPLHRDAIRLLKASISASSISRAR